MASYVAIVAQAGAVRIDGVDAPWPIREMAIIEKLEQDRHATSRYSRLLSIPPTVD